MSRDPGNPEAQVSRVKIEVTAGSIVWVLLAIAVAVMAANVLVEARRIISWCVACAVVAALIELVVNWLDRWMRRSVAIVLVLLTLGGIAGVLVFGVFHDLDVEVRRLQTETPIAAQSIENSDRFGSITNEVNLDRRVTEAVHQLNSPSSGLAGEAVFIFRHLFRVRSPNHSFLVVGTPSRKIDNAATWPGCELFEYKRLPKLLYSRPPLCGSGVLASKAIAGLVGWLVCLHTRSARPNTACPWTGGFYFDPQPRRCTWIPAHSLIDSGTRTVGNRYMGSSVVPWAASCISDVGATENSSS